MADVRKTIEILLQGHNRTQAAFSGTVAGARAMADNTIGHVSRVSSRILNLQNLIAGSAAAMAAKSLFEPAIDIERAETEFGVLLKSVDLAKEHLQDLADFAAETPLQFGDLRNASKRLLNVNVDLERIIPTLRMLGDAAGGDSERLERLVNAYTKLKTRGRATMEELNLFIDAGVPILAELGKQYGKTGEEMFKLISAGKVGFPQVERALRSLTGAGGLYEGMMAKVSQKTAGLISTLGDNWEAVRREVGEGALPALSDAVTELLETVTELRNSGQLEEWGDDARVAVDELWQTLKDLAAFIHDNWDALKNLGFTYAGVRVVMGLTVAVDALSASMKTYAVAQTAAAASTAASTTAMTAQTMASFRLAGSIGGVAGALAWVGAVAATAFAGYNIGKIIAQTTGLYDRLVDVYSQMKLMGATEIKPELEMAQEMWRNKHGSLDGFNEFWKHDQRRRVASPEPGPRKAKQTTEDTQLPPAGDVEAEIAAQQKKIQQAVTTELRRREQLYLRKKAAEDRLAEMEAEDAHNRAMEKVDAEIEYEREARARLRKAKEDSIAEAKRLEEQAQAAFDRFLNPDKAEADDKQAEAKAKQMERLERRIAAARARQEKGLSITKRGKELLAADDIRIAASQAKGEAGANDRDMKVADNRIGGLEADRFALQAARDAAQAAKERAAVAKRADIATELAKGPLSEYDDETLRRHLPKPEKITLPGEETVAQGMPFLQPGYVPDMSRFDLPMPPVPFNMPPNPIAAVSPGASPAGMGNGDTVALLRSIDRNTAQTAQKIDKQVARAG